MKIILATINARYSHTSFGLRYLKANLREFENQTQILEYSQDAALTDIAEEIILKRPDIVGFGCYIWNIEQILKVCEIIKSILPECIIVLGGPEVSYENNEFLPHCDYLIEGEGEFALYHLIQKIAQKEYPQTKILNEPICDLSQIKMPYYLYSDEDIQNRLIYVEATRGCPFTCEFCISSLAKGVREFDLDLFLDEMDNLLKRGLKQFKFVDRTFNLKLSAIKKILTFFKERWQDGMHLHFEIFPDKLNAEMLEEIKNFPPGGLHLEAGVQSFFEPSLKAISRRQDEAKTLQNLKYIIEETGAEIHADLVAGLPHSTWQTFEEDFNKLYAIHPHELQIGILKKLRGAPIKRHDQEFAMVYSQYPPYEIMQNKDLSYTEMQKIKRMARFFDLYYNSRRFPQIHKCLPDFKSWIDFSQYIWNNYRQTHKISLKRQQEILEEYCHARNLASPL